jgi:hypothetical protein
VGREKNTSTSDEAKRYFLSDGLNTYQTMADWFGDIGFFGDTNLVVNGKLFPFDDFQAVHDELEALAKETGALTRKDAPRNPYSMYYDGENLDALVGFAID